MRDKEKRERERGWSKGGVKRLVKIVKRCCRWGGGVNAVLGGAKGARLS